LVYNKNPIVVDIDQTEYDIYRTDRAIFYINGSDHETLEEQLNFYIQYKNENEIVWEILEGKYSDQNSNWESQFRTDILSKLGFYDFRIKFEDDETASSGWHYLNHSLEVKNNIPFISDSCDDFLITSTPVHFDLTKYEFDVEDTDQDLIWNINQSTVDLSLFSANIIIPSEDILTLSPMENAVGSDDITLILTDKDGGVYSKSNVTVHVNNTSLSTNYGVSISVSPALIELLQDESQYVTLTVNNIGNIQDDYILYCDPFEFFDLKIEISSTLISLDPQESRRINVELTSTENFNLTDDLHLQFFAKSERVLNSTLLIITFTDISNWSINDNDPPTENDLISIGNIDNFILVILIIIIILVFATTMFIGGTEIGKYKILSLILIPLYNKLNRDEVLDNFIRGKIYGYILAKPGDHYNAIKKALGLNNGTFIHHVRILEKEKYVYSKRDGFFTRFYPGGIKMPSVNEPPLNELQKSIVESVRENPGITQHEIVMITGASQQVVSYNLTNLTRENILKTDLNGREKKYFINYEELMDAKSNILPTVANSK
jgi:predicted transcriptional regulator